MKYVTIENRKISRFILGSNPFSGFSHQTPETDLAMKRYYTSAQIKATLRTAESLGINTVIGRTDHHMLRLLLEYGDEGGQIQWFAQTCPEIGDHATCVNRAADGGAKACHIHGGVVDFLLAQKRTDELPPVVAMIRDKGMLAGIAGHSPDVFRWAHDHLDVDYYMCSYYNAAHRDQKAELVSGVHEWFPAEDRAVMSDVIQSLTKPVIHYKIMAAGRNEPKAAFAWAASHMRASDAVCVGVFPRDIPDMLERDVRLFEAALDENSA